MPRKAGSNEGIIHALHQVEGGEKVAEVSMAAGQYYTEARLPGHG